MDVTKSKLELSGARTPIDAAAATAVLAAIFRQVGCAQTVAAAIAEHLVDASLCGVESHGVMRALQYVEQFESGYMRADAVAQLRTPRTGVVEIDGGGGSGVPAMALAFEEATARARDAGLSAAAIRNVGHTGRHGAFADHAAARGFLTILTGGGNRKVWPQVAPYGGAKGVLPTNPWCVGVPGGARGPVVLDFATSKIAGGWIYAARSAGAQLPEGCVIDRHGAPTRDPADYFDGGAILPAGEQKGYALALVAEMIAEAMLGPATTECHWLLICLDALRFRDAGALQTAAEEVLRDVRACPPAPGFERVEVPGERERARRAAAGGVIAVPEATWTQILDMARRLGVDPPATLRSDQA